MTHKNTQQLLDAVSNKNLAEAKEALVAMENSIKAKDMEMIQDITQPAVITDLHKKLIETFGVNNRAMMLKNRVPLRNNRALLFVKAMQNGLSRVPE